MKITRQYKVNVRTRNGTYNIILQKWSGESGYVVRVPKFPEIVTQGETLAEARAMAREAIELCAECSMKERGTKNFRVIAQSA
jgi:predicted RNase H-like HicB family nuclease